MSGLLIATIGHQLSVLNLFPSLVIFLIGLG